MIHYTGLSINDGNWFHETGCKQNLLLIQYMKYVLEA